MKPRFRVIIDNDFSGDPDDLYALVHHLLSPSVEIPFIVGSHLRPGDHFDPSTSQADNAARVATEWAGLLGSDVPVIAGSNTGLADPRTPVPSAASEAIIREALRDDTELPLFIAVGGGMTELASAVLTEPRIAQRLTAVWIGGEEHPGLGLPFPAAPQTEYNLAIDLPAAQAVFDSDVTLWQVPRDTYRQALISRAEIEVRVRSHGVVGRRLADAIDELARSVEEHFPMGETYCMGDQPLVLLTALHSAFESDPSSSTYVTRPTPAIDERGRYVHRPDGRPMRVYTAIDNRLMFEDFYAKLALFAARSG
ncbi:nucleoside hydrolase [Microbacterium sp. LRZ72]|uniref:nucleoside hydrolase n=1 Tax=Microbacterium sp. LRZ72 TaxID=2942481 RepID=UPI0029A0942E|nr:nucleoside hydrolase [Microbacterium sp. LRZ72]MDX2376465.1 nucleoside hydrolase [Microbacterium sp. LRZ72]